VNWSDINFAPPRRTLRQFAGLWLAIFLALAARLAWREAPAAYVAGVAALALSVGLLGLCRPGVIRPLFVGLTIATFPLGWLVSRVVLAGLFYGLFTPVGLFFRLIGRDPLRLRAQPGLDTYWLAKPAAADVRGYFRQF
jgi:hypothetical protein